MEGEFSVDAVEEKKAQGLNFLTNEDVFSVISHTVLTLHFKGPPVIISVITNHIFNEGIQAFSRSLHDLKRLSCQISRRHVWFTFYKSHRG